MFSTDKILFYYNSSNVMTDSTYNIVILRLPDDLTL